MNRSYAPACLWTCFLALVSSAQELPVAKPEAVGLSSEKLARITPALQALVDKHETAGAITMIARRGKVVYFEAVGKRDVDSGKPMQPDTILRFYSMTKPITSTAVMMLVEAGKLGLDEPLAKYLPELKDLQVFKKLEGDKLETEPAKRPPTVRDLLRHTAGFTYGFLGITPVDLAYRKAGILAPQNTLAQMTRKLGAIPLLYQPGTKWHYSVSADVSARLVEVVSGKSFDQFLYERIFGPLDMHDTGFFVPSNKLERFAAVHSKTLGILRVTDAPATSSFSKPAKFLSGGGGLVSTARDYMRFCQMIASGGEFNGHRLLRPETVLSMTTNQLPEAAFPISLGLLPAPGVGFGLGFSVQVKRNPFSAAHVGEYGWGGAASTHFWISPKDELIVIVLQQFTPFTLQLENTVKPLVYNAIQE